MKNSRLGLNIAIELTELQHSPAPTFTHQPRVLLRFSLPFSEYINVIAPHDNGTRGGPRVRSKIGSISSRRTPTVHLFIRCCWSDKVYLGYDTESTVDESPPNAINTEPSPPGHRYHMPCQKHRSCSSHFHTLNTTASAEPLDSDASP